MNMDKYGTLGFVSGRSNFRNLPNWASYLVEIGKYSSMFHVTNQRLVMGVILPTRAYAAAFSAAGSTIGKTLSENEDEVSYKAHMEKIKLLKPGSPVTLLSPEGNKAQKGKFQEIRYTNNSPSLIAVATSSGNQKAGGVVNLIRPEQCLRIKIDETNEDDIKELPVNEKRYDLSSDKSFISNLIGNINVDRFQFNSTNDTLIVGKEKQLKPELLNQSFLSKYEDKISGPSELQDIIRVKRFASSGNFSSRTRFLHDTGTRRKIDLSKATDSEGLATAIFDGGRAFLKWGRSIGGVNSMVLLPRNDRNFTQTVHQINERYYLREDDLTETQIPVQRPDGVEIVFFTEIMYVS